MKPKSFVAHLASIRLPNVFNPYSDQCEVYDLPDASKIRRENLENVLNAVLTQRSRTIWIGRDLGHRGGRRTGIALTDDIHIAFAAQTLGNIELRRATKGPAMKEQTAATVWGLLMQLKQAPLLWNVFPLHPHLPAKPFTNRTHTSAEREIGLHILSELIEMIRPERLLTIGGDAQKATQKLTVPSIKVRHPSYGGQAEFRAGVRKLYDTIKAEKRSTEN